MLRRRFTATLAGLGAATLAAPLVRAQTWPVRSIRYIVPVAAGGGSDLVGRTVTERWAKALGQNFVVENIGGGGGAIACQTTAKAAPDGYTLLQGYVATHGTSPATRSKLPYDPVRDFTPIGMIGATPNVLVVNASLPVTSVAEFTEWLRRNEARASYGSAGQGSLTHLTMELYKQATNTRPTAALPRPSPTCWPGRPRPCSRAWPRRCRTSARARCARWPSRAARVTRR
jgi:tripartite-type tricarboxylate transporter receptor subunit TctC